MSKDLKIILLGRFFQVIIILVSIRILTTYLSPNEVGNYYIILAYLSFFNLVLLNPPGMYFSRHLLEWQKSKNLFNALVVFMMWILIVAIISVPISVFVYYLFGYETKFDINLFSIYILMAIIISTVHRNILYGSNTLGFRKEFVYYLIITSLIGLFSSIIFIKMFSPIALSWLFGVIFSESIVIYAIFNFFIQDNKVNINLIKRTLSKAKIKEILWFCVPIGITTFLMWGQTSAYRFIVDYKYSAEILGFIGIGLGISSSVFGTIETISMQYFKPIFLKKIFNASKDERADAWNEIAKEMVPIYILALFFSINMSEVLINILVDKKFHASYIYAMIGVFIEFFRVMTNLLNNVAQSEKVTISTIKPYLLGFTISIGLLSSIDFGTNYFMIPLVLAIAYLFVFILMYINMKKLLNIKYDINIIKIVFLSLPFFMIYIFDVKAFKFIDNLFVLLVFGIYFISVIWFMYHQRIRNDK